MTIVTINRNDSTGLARTLSSVAEQTCRDFEHLIIDGGSTDGSLDIIRQFEPGLAYWCSEPDGGIYHAMNKGIAKARGRYLLFLNAGDHFLDAGSLELAAPCLSGEQLVYFNLRLVPVGDPGPSQWRLPAKLDFWFFIKSTLPHSSTFIAADLFTRYGPYDEDLRITSDWKAFLLWVCKYNCSYRGVPQMLCVFYQNGLSSRPESQAVIAQEREKTMLGEFPTVYQDVINGRNAIEKLQSLRRNTLIKLLQRVRLMKQF